MTSTLSGGEARRVDLAATLLKRPDILLLDEPTNQIDARNILWLEDFLEHYGGSCVLVTHDRYFLDRIVTRIVEIDHNALYMFPGNYTRFLEHKTNLIEQQVREETGRQAILRRELAWVMQGARARTTKEKARMDKFKELQAQAPPPIPKEIQFEIPTPKRLGKKVLEAHSIVKRYGDRVLFRDFTIIVQHGMRVGVIGPNGCGKTTLLRVLMRLERPDKGKVVAGDNTQFLYVDQTHGDVNLDQTILEYVSDGAQFWEFAEYDRGDARRIYVPGYLERFLFDRAAVLTPMRNLSGGELARIDLAKKLLRGGNFIVLDEPTNDLDLPTLRVIEEAILAFDGCALIVSHDRYFLNRTCTHIVSFEGEGNVLVLAGNYDDYAQYKVAHPAPAGEAPSKPPRGEQAAPRAGRRGGLTWSEKQELARMDAQIEEAEGAVARLESEVGAPGFYRADSAAKKKGLAALDAAKERVESLYTRWQELESRRAAGS
ncbi:MAG: ATP-binding cassette domain-containing protein [Candidatus Hydrogenedentes bacterium]|nr:ATP-binding cassette domain-containing protein [Candidatus Hydrogenedentota bacterium]